MKLRLERRRIDYIPDEELFAEMQRIWSELGHRPSRTEWEQSNPRYSYITYRRHFNGWVNACIAFVDYMSSGNVPTRTSRTERAKNPPTKDKRDVPDKLRISVLKRDDFKCVLCGRSPALERGVVLHVDHIVPFADGGKTELPNLQTLCNRCNWGKGKRSNDDIF